MLALEGARLGAVMRRAFVEAPFRPFWLSMLVAFVVTTAIGYGMGLRKGDVIPPNAGRVAAREAAEAGCGVKALGFRREACRHACFADLDGAPAITLVRGRYGQVLGPARYFPKFANGLGGHADAPVYLDPHLRRPRAKNNLKRSNTFWFVSHGAPSLPARLATQ